MIKLTDKQKDILIKMDTGWQLAEYMTLDGGCMIQKGGIGYGGEAISLRRDMAIYLWKKGLIKQTKAVYPNRFYALTESGIELLRDLKSV